MNQKQLILSYYQARPRQSIQHKDAVDWSVSAWHKLTGTVFRDPDRAIRSLHQEGILIKDGKGVYRYDPDLQQSKTIEDFTPAIKQTILKRDNHKCVICGKSKKDGVELHIDHIKPKDRGGRAILSNGQVLCGQHNYLKKNYDINEAGKQFFIRLHEMAIANKDLESQKFCQEILDIYDKYNYDSHLKPSQDTT